MRTPFMTKLRKADLIMHYIPQIRKDDIADIYVAGMKLFSVRLGEIDCSFETVEIRKEVRPGVLKWQFLRILYLIAKSQ